jgi:putative ABC transport system permease protein
VKLAWMALRNLARNRRRTALSLLVVAAGSAAMLLTAGFIAYSFEGLGEALVRGGLGHFEIVPAAALAPGSVRLDRPAGEGFEEWMGLRDFLESISGVEAVGATVHLLGMISAGDASASFVGVGVEPDREARMGFTIKLRAGQELPLQAPEAGEDVVLLAQGLAETLGVTPGDLVTLLAMTPDGTLNALDARVAGIYSTGVQDLDTRFSKMHLATGQRLLETAAVSNLLVTSAPGWGLAAARQALEDRLAGHQPALAVLDWQARAPFYDQVRNLYLGIFWFLGSVILVLVVLAASNTLLMAVLERTRELGTLRAIGTSRLQIALMVLFEAFWLGLLGGAAGSALGAVAILAINAMGLEMPPPPGAVDPVALRLALVPEAVAGGIALMVVVLAVAAALPALRAIRLRVVDALAHV